MRVDVSTTAAVYSLSPEGWAHRREQTLRERRYWLRVRTHEEEAEWIRWEDSRRRSIARRRRK